MLIAFVAASLAANYRFYWFRATPVPSERLGPSHQQRRAFVERVAQTTEPSACFGFLGNSTKRYIPRRFQYLLAGRQVLSPLRRTQRQPGSPGVVASGRPAKERWRLLWRGPDGSLWVAVG